MNEKLTPDLIAQVTADTKAATKADDFRELLAEVAVHRMVPLLVEAGISPLSPLGREIAVSLLATVEVAATAGIHAYLAHTLGVPLGDLIEAVMPEAAAEAEEMAEADRADPTNVLIDAIRSALETFMATEDDDDGFVDEFERAAYREMRPEFKALDHSACRVGDCAHSARAEAELKLRAAERRARAAAPEADPAPRPETEPEPEPALAADHPPLTPEQQDRRYPGLPRGSDD